MKYVPDHPRALRAPPELSQGPVLDWLAPRIDWDPVLAGELTDGRLTIDGDPVELSGVELAACTLASTVLRETYRGPSLPSVALALPRGSHSLALLVGIHLTLRRRHQRMIRRRNYGSVLITAGRTVLRELASRLALDGNPLAESLVVARLAVEQTATGRLRAAALPMDGGYRRRLSQ